MQLKVSDIQLDKKLSPREGVDETTVGAYANSFDALPPVDVFWIEGRDGWWLADGWHRVEAAKKNETADIEATEHQGTLDDAVEFSFDANLKHGRPLTMKERKQGARLKLVRHTERSNRWIAEDCGIDHKTVGSLREDLERPGEIPHVTTFLSKDGTYYERPKPKAEEKASDPVEPVTLYKGKMEDVLPKLKGKFDLVIADPPYGVTDYEWDELDTKAWLQAITPHLNVVRRYHLPSENAVVPILSNVF